MSKSKLPLGEKITTWEQFKAHPFLSNAVLRRDEGHIHLLRLTYPILVPSCVTIMPARRVEPTDLLYKFVVGSFASTTECPKIYWPVVREMYRRQANMEEYGPVLNSLYDELGTMVSYLPRPCLEDPMMVEFFPSYEAMVNERPIKTSMAKFLRKVCPLFTDEYIRDMDAAHRAWQANDIELLEGIEGFRLGYTTGPHSCMAVQWFQKDNFPAFEGHHPVDAYGMTPGLKLAVSRGSSGAINGRCVVYINPNNEKDKRMIRVYGDTSLERRLIRAGFEYKSLVGVPLGVLPIALPTADKGHKSYVIPYLDGLKGEHGLASATRSVVLCEGKFWPLTKAMQASINATKVYAKETPSTGLFTCMELPAGQNIITCPVTGTVIDLLREELKDTVNVWVNGKILSVPKSKALTDRFTECAFDVNELGRREHPVFYERSAPPVIFGYQGVDYIESDSARFCFGFVKLDPRWYPESEQTGWIDANKNRYFHNTEAEYIWLDAAHRSPYVIRTVDAVQVYDYVDGDAMSVDYEQHGPESWPTLAQRPYHKDQFKQALADGGQFVQVHSIERGKPIYVTARVKTVKTATGRTVVPRLHQLARLYTGEWAFERNCKKQSLWGISVVMLKSEPVVLQGAIDSPPMQYALRQWLENTVEDTDFLTSYGRHLIDDNITWESVLWNAILRQHRISIRANRIALGVLPEIGVASMPRDLEWIKQGIAGGWGGGTLEHNEAEARRLIRAFRALRVMYLTVYAKWCETHPGQQTVPTRITVDTSLPNDPDTTVGQMATLPVRPEATPLEALYASGTATLTPPLSTWTTVDVQVPSTQTFRSTMLTYVPNQLNEVQTVNPAAFGHITTGMFYNEPVQEIEELPAPAPVLPQQ